MSTHFGYNTDDVIDDSTKRYIKEYTIEIAERLKIKHEYFVEFLPESVVSKDYCGYCGSNDCIVIKSNMSPYDILSTIAHEMRHMWQFTKGYLKDHPDGYVFWNGKQYWKTCDNDSEFNEFLGDEPWEEDAEDFEKSVSQLTALYTCLISEAKKKISYDYQLFKEFPPL